MMPRYSLKARSRVLRLAYGVQDPLLTRETLDRLHKPRLLEVPDQMNLVLYAALTEPNPAKIRDSISQATGDQGGSDEPVRHRQRPAQPAREKARGGRGAARSAPSRLDQGTPALAGGPGGAVREIRPSTRGTEPCGEPRPEVLVQAGTAAGRILADPGVTSPEKPCTHTAGRTALVPLILRDGPTGSRDTHPVSGPSLQAPLQDPAAPPPRPTLREATRFWWRLGWISFGGPAGQIALMHEELVERRRWVGHDTFLHALQFCMVLPGPEAQQLATYLGWCMHGTRGGLIAGTLFVLPAAAILLGLSVVYVLWGSTPGVTGILRGLQPAVVALIANALIHMGRRVIRNITTAAFALAAAVALGITNAPFPLVIALAGALGVLRPRNASGTDPTVSTHEVPTSKTSPRSDWVRVGRILGLGILLWLAPMVLLALLLGSDHVVVQEGLFFGKAALVTFGGAYAVLPYVAQRAVEHFHWLGSDSMMHGLALAETTPGPLVIVLQFAGFLGGWNHPGSLPGWFRPDSGLRSRCGARFFRPSSGFFSGRPGCSGGVRCPDSRVSSMPSVPQSSGSWPASRSGWGCGPSFRETGSTCLPWSSPSPRSADCASSNGPRVGWWPAVP